MKVRVVTVLSVAALAACAAQGSDFFDATSGPAQEPNATQPDASSSSSSSGGGSSSGGSSSSSSGSSGSNDAGSDAQDASVTPTAPFEASPCSGPAITSAEVLSHFGPAATSTTFGTVWSAARKRNCQDQTGCQGWQPASSADLFRIQWVTGTGFTFVSPTTLSLPSTGTITCTVPGPSCTLTIAPMTSNVFPPEQGRPLGITPRIAGSQVQVGSWSDHAGNYVQYTNSMVTSSCLWGTTSGRVYGASATYVETQLVVWGSF
jgi:hypothetical protein